MSKPAGMDYESFVRYRHDRALKKLLFKPGRPALQEAIAHSLEAAEVLSSAILNDDVSGQKLMDWRYDDRCDFDEICERTLSAKDAWKDIDEADILFEVTSRCPSNGIVWARTTPLQSGMREAVLSECERRGIDVKEYGASTVAILDSFVRFATRDDCNRIDLVDYAWSVGFLLCDLSVHGEG